MKPKENDIPEEKTTKSRKPLILVISIVIVIIIAAVSGSRYQFVKKIKKVDTKLRFLSTALIFYHQDHGAFPENLYQITTPTAYFIEIPRDPFSPDNTIYEYKALEDESEIIIYSYGPDNDDDKGEKIYDPTNGYNRSDGDMIRKVEKPKSVF
jgi:hypothetical protein